MYHVVHVFRWPRDLWYLFYKSMCFPSWCGVVEHGRSLIPSRLFTSVVALIRHAQGLGGEEGGRRSLDGGAGDGAKAIGYERGMLITFQGLLFQRLRAARARVLKTEMARLAKLVPPRLSFIPKRRNVFILGVCKECAMYDTGATMHHFCFLGSSNWGPKTSPKIFF